MTPFRPALPALVCALAILTEVPSVVAGGSGVWTPLVRTTQESLTRVQFHDTHNGWVAGKGGTILRTTDGGAQWVRQQPNTRAEIADLFMLDFRNGWALGSVRYDDSVSWYGTQILKTTNGGDTWEFGTPPGLGKYYNRVVFADTLLGWLCGAYGDLLRTTDGGISWTPADVDSGFRWFWPMLNMRFQSREVGYAMGGTWDLIGLLWKTTDGGSQWHVQQVSPEPVYDLHFLDSLNILGIVGDLDYGVSMIRTTDGGAGWSYRFLGPPGLPTALGFRTPREGWAALGFPGTFLTTTDAGESWSTVPTPGNVPVYDLVFVDSATGYAVGDSGTILRYGLPSTEVGEGKSSHPASHTILRPAYPNPWNSSTTVIYTLGSDANIVLSLYSILGEEVARPDEGRRQAGTHRVTIPGNGLPSGSYVLALNVNGAVTTTRCVLLR